MPLAFLNSKGLIYAHTMPRGTTISTNFTVKALSKFLVYLRRRGQ
jgi:hypothetical protein